MKIQQKVKLQWTPRIQMSKGKISVKPSVYFISWSKRPWPVLSTHTQIWLNQLLAFLNLYRHAKNQFIPAVHLWDTVNFKVQWPDWLHPFLPILTQIIFDKLLFFVNLNKHVKINLFHLFILQVQSILESSHQTKSCLNWLKSRFCYFSHFNPALAD